MALLEDFEGLFNHLDGAKTNYRTIRKISTVKQSHAGAPYRAFYLLEDSSGSNEAIVIRVTVEEIS